MESRIRAGPDKESNNTAHGAYLILQPVTLASWWANLGVLSMEMQDEKSIKIPGVFAFPNEPAHGKSKLVLPRGFVQPRASPRRRSAPTPCPWRRVRYADALAPLARYRRDGCSRPQGGVRPSDRASLRACEHAGWKSSEYQTQKSWPRRPAFLRLVLPRGFEPLSPE